MSRKPRILLKLSGESLAPEGQLGYDPLHMTDVADQIAGAAPHIALAIVIGGGNLIRGNMLKGSEITPVTSDQMGMLATIQNALALQDLLLARGIPVYTGSAFGIPGVVEAFDHRKGLRKLNKGTVVICAGGTGNPYVTTDSTASLRASMLQMDLILKATQVDGIYNKDPRKHSDAIRYEVVTFEDAIQLKLGVMDRAAFLQCQENRIPIRVFDSTQPNALKEALLGKPLGTLCHEGEVY